MIRLAAATALKLLCGCRARWIEAPTSNAPRLYFANHTSHLDALIVWSALPRAQRVNLRVIAARDYWDRGPFRRWLACKVFRAVLISRDNPTKSDNAISAVTDSLSEGSSVLFFPEGTRHNTQTIAEFRPGLWHIARACPGVDLTPVWIENIGRALPKGEFLPLPILSAVTFGAPTRMQENEPKEDFLTRARDAIAALRETDQ